MRSLSVQEPVTANTEFSATFISSLSKCDKIIKNVEPERRDRQSFNDMELSLNGLKQKYEIRNISNASCSNFRNLTFYFIILFHTRNSLIIYEMNW